MFIFVQLVLLALPLVAVPPLLLVLPLLALWLLLLLTETLLLLPPLIVMVVLLPLPPVHWAGGMAATVMRLFTKATVLLRSKAAAGKADNAEVVTIKTDMEVAATSFLRGPAPFLAQANW